MTFFGITKSTTTRGDNLKKLKEAAIVNRIEIEKKLKDTKIVDQQLVQVISDTRQLTTVINQKLNTRLKITNKTLKSICHNLKDGVIIVNHTGKVVEVNLAFETIFTVPKSEVIGANIRELCVRLAALQDGCKLEMIDFDKNSRTTLEHSINKKEKKCTKNCFECDSSCENNLDVHLNVELEVHPSDTKSFICNVGISALDNDPEQLDDVHFILFFKCQEIPTKKRRSVKK